MWSYEKRLQFPVNIKEPNAKLAQVIISQYGGPDGEMGASMRYLSQRYSMPFKEVAGLLTDIGTEELGHLEMVATIVHQLTQAAIGGHAARQTDLLCPGVGSSQQQFFGQDARNALLEAGGHIGHAHFLTALLGVVNLVDNGSL